MRLVWFGSHKQINFVFTVILSWERKWISCPKSTPLHMPCNWSTFTLHMNVLSLALWKRHFTAGEIWKGRSESPQERVQKELQTSIKHCITYGGMGHRKQCKWQERVLSPWIQEPSAILKIWPVSFAIRTWLCCSVTCCIHAVNMLWVRTLTCFTASRCCTLCHTKITKIKTADVDEKLTDGQS